LTTKPLQEYIICSTSINLLRTPR